MIAIIWNKSQNKTKLNKRKTEREKRVRQVTSEQIRWTNETNQTEIWKTLIHNFCAKLLKC